MTKTLAGAFGKSVAQSSIVDEYRNSFAIGSSPDTLSAEDRAIYEKGVKAFNEAAKANKPTCEEAFRKVYETIPARLDVTGKVQEDAGAHHLTREQQDFFATYGVLPPITLDAVSPDLIDSIDRLCCGLVQGSGLNGVSATPAWIFDRDLLTLATHPDIIDKIASLLGEQVTFLGSDGPMFLKPNSDQQTAWHAFDASHFGGGGGESNLQQVSVWVALADAMPANGCMRIAPGTYRAFAALNEVAPKFYGADVHELIDIFVKNENKVDPTISARILCRHLNDKNFPDELMRLGSSKDSPQGYRYNPFHSAVDKAWCIGERAITTLDESPKVLMEAKRAQAYFFTSQNAHSSLKNKTSGWRKAIALRYVTTAKASKAIIQQTTHRLRMYTEQFPGASDVLKAVNRGQLDVFEAAGPRLCVRGSVPAGQEQFYFDQKQLLSELDKRGGSLLPRTEPLPTA